MVLALYDWTGLVWDTHQKGTQKARPCQMPPIQLSIATEVSLARPPQLIKYSGSARKNCEVNIR
jgi:hypothetical protein